MYAWSQGIVVVTAAGNAGPDPVSVGVPANNPYVITVGAFTDNYTPADWSDDYIAPFSSAGPTADAFVKPDLVAPGGHIISSQKPGTVLWKTYPDARVSPFYFKMAGTSQAAAVTSGVAALMLSANPGLTNDEVKYRLMATALPWADENLDNLPYSLWQQGMGRLNAPDAVSTVITGTANAGMDILADLAGTAHFQGYTEYDPETNEFTLGGGLSNWSGGLGNWSGAEGSWSGGLGNWSGGFGNWSGGLGNWSGGLGNWSGGLGNWSGGLGNWSGGLGNWSGGLGNWSGGLGNWSGGFGNWSGAMGDWSGGFGNWSGSYDGWDDLNEWPGNVLIPGSVVIEP
jgi:serine protease AprX